MTIEKTVKQYLYEDAHGHHLDHLRITKDDYLNIGHMPHSSSEAKDHLLYWRNVLSQFGEGVEKVKFFYQENDKELPLSFKEKILKKLGADIEPKFEEGKVYHEIIFPEYMRGLDPFEMQAKFILEKEDWKRVSKISKNTDGFTTKDVYSPGANYLINVPLEVIEEVKFTEGLLESPYKERK